LTAGITSIESIKQLEASPENFPLYMAQLSNSNINSLFSIADPLSNNNNEFSSILGSVSGSSSDPFAMFGELSSSDPLANIFSSQGITSDFSFMTPSLSMDSVQVMETLKGLQDYSNVNETKAWMGQMVEYTDPTDTLLKTGTVEKIIIENVHEPVFIVDGKELKLEDIKALTS